MARRVNPIGIPIDQGLRMASADIQLFDGEGLSIIQDAGDQSPPLDPEMRYATGEVRIVTDQARYPLSAVPGLLRSGDYKMNPEFQRRHRWSRIQQSRLIESFIMNVPIPPIFLYEDEFGHYEVMDGLQRLTALNDFYSDAFPLDGLQEWSELNGHTYSQLPEKIKKGIDRRYLSSIVLLQETAKTDSQARELKQLVFERINSGGVRLTPQESRNALLDGPMNQLCQRLARNSSLCRLWGIPEPSETEVMSGVPDRSDDVWESQDYRSMADVELVLRFFAYRQFLSLQKNLPLRDYLDAYLKSANQLPEDVRAAMSLLFEETIQLAEDLLGEEAFFLWRPRKDGSWNWNRKPTLTAFDPWMIVLSQRTQYRDDLVAKRDEIRRGVQDMYQNNFGEWGGRTADASDVRRRILLLGEFLENFVAE